MFRLLYLPFALFIFSASCQSKQTPPVGNVRGLVTLDGEPLSGANILFQPESGRPSQAKTDPNGIYELQYLAGTGGALIGRHTVRVFVPTPDREEQQDLVEEKRQWPVIPTRYNTESELFFEVKPGPNKADFHLTKSPPKKP